jgi:hypothetical protein
VIASTSVSPNRKQWSLFLAVPAIGAAGSTDIGVAYRPLAGLLRTHRAADDERRALEPEALGQQLVLRPHVVADAHLREAHRIGRVVRRRRQPVADLVDDDDEVLDRIERAAGADVHLLDDFAGARVPGRHQDRIVLGRVDLAVGGDGKLAAAQCAFLEVEVADVISSYGPWPSCA